MKVSSPQSNPSAPLILHVLPADIARGGQTYVRALRDALDDNSYSHRTLTLFGAEGAALRPDIALGARSGLLRTRGFDPSAFLRLRRALSRLDPALVVAHGGESLKYAALARRSSCPPLIYHRIGISSRKLRNPLRRAFHRVLIRRADAVVAISMDTLEELRKLLPSTSLRMVTIDNARDANEFIPLDTPERTPCIFFVGHFAKTKRPEVFLDVVGSLRQEGLDFNATMVGDGPLLPTLEAKAAAAGVELLGGRDDVPQLLREAGVLLFTSIAEGEGLPGVLIEAGLSGVPTVSTDVPGARAAIRDGETGFVVPVDDRGAMVSAVRRLISEPEIRMRMGAAARDHCLAHFTIEATAAKWARLMDEVMSNR